VNEVSLRTSAERLTFCDHYFAAVGASPVLQSDNYREYELPRDVDKEMTDRPYYWMWVENMQQVVPPSVLRLAFTEEALKRENERLKAEALTKAEAQGMNDIQRMYFRPPTAEFVTLGSFRLDKLFASLDNRGKFACVMPKSATSTSNLVPWLMINALISYRCDVAEQRFISIGICLSNSQIVERFYEMIQKIEMQPMLPSTISDPHSIGEGWKKIRVHLEKKLMRESHNWATDAQQRLSQELVQLETYYRSILPDIPPSEHTLVETEMTRKIRELTERTQPRIDIHCKQVALVGLLERA
jgi:hypothetical protein